MYGPQLAACGLEARAPRRCRGDGVYRCMRARCLCTRHAGATPAHPGGAGVMGCIAVYGRDARAPRRCRGDGVYAVCGRNACAPGMRAGSPRTQVAYRWRRAGSPRSQVVYRCMRAGRPCSQHAGWTPAHPGGVSRYAGWKPAHPGGASLYAGETPAHPACGRDACAPRRGVSLRQAGSPRSQTVQG